MDNSGITDEDWRYFEQHAQIERDYGNMSLVAIGVLASPVVATLSPEIVAVSLKERLLAAGANALLQTAFSASQNGFKAITPQNINISSIAGSFIAPGLPLTSAVIGNGFKLTYSGGYSGISATSNGASILTNIGLDYLGGRLGQWGGWETGGAIIGNGLQNAYDFYSGLNSK